MIERVTADILFPSGDEARDFYRDCLLALAKGISINPDKPYEERSTILHQECFHDEDPPRPCIIINQETL